ncbi:MAG: HPr family phosphocarrier protein [Oscillospiraceae bacterium]|nr:HPr family phosphocarrier protein [Oscillospiraceae bacterium]
MKQFDFTIKDPLGIHARPAGQLAKAAKGFGDTIVTITKDGNTVKASQLMKIMSMGIKNGQTVTIAAEGPAEDEAIEAMKKFFEENL